ncbi:hypothetical protein [uncultured Sneathiella sp.]|uniref:hypothetical protein n=1 Tax=uncultured Sneathiella sp. TaxID=879315 RepID=UPI0030EE7EA9|tara:strand:+ start:21125 stop:21535 length:411 start_codon:yes stop_codon:yes gene_type:complete
MNYSLIFAIIISLTLPSLAAAKDGTVTAAEGWNNSAGFQTSYDILTKSIIAELIEKKENGFYDGFDQNNTFITNIGAQTNTIGAQTIFNGGTHGSVSVTTTNCGDTASIASSDSSGSNHIEAHDVTCTVPNNASNP